MPSMPVLLKGKSIFRIIRSGHIADPELVTLTCIAMLGLDKADSKAT